LIVAGVTLISRAVDTANITEWAKLALSDLQARVLRETRLRHGDQGQPVALEKVVLVLDQLPGLVTSGGNPVPDIAELAYRYGLSLSLISERISIAPATGEVAQHLAVAPGASVMKADRVVETADGVPIEWRVAFSKP
jgi:DNA-binding GntR family transcriptional regulator